MKKYTIDDVQLMLNGLFKGGDITEAARSSLQFIINQVKKSNKDYAN